jgi:hypothetical protein
MGFVPGTFTILLLCFKAIDNWLGLVFPGNNCVAQWLILQLRYHQQHHVYHHRLPTY